MARGAADWLVEDAGLEGEDPSVCQCRAGVLLALEEAAHVLGDDRYARAVADGLCKLIAAVENLQDSSLYSRLSQLRRDVLPGQAQDGDFLGGGLLGVSVP